MFSNLIALPLLITALTSCLAQTTHTITVGTNGTKTFTPTDIQAAIGDVVNFQFVTGNHTATQSTFAVPCTNNGGFKSGFKPASANDIATFAIMVNTTDPIWGYCGQVGHCQAGMVFAINAPETGNKTFAAFQSAAMSVSAGDGSNSSSSGSGTSAGANGSSSSLISSAGMSTGTGAASSTAASAGSASTLLPCSASMVGALLAGFTWLL
ncbi:Cupredoxin [Naematelia encephala]|uniref:Cupredoxin n=1 Tax=Naematelia encephala TaxID=71784 RepID=A0A1Y2AZ02_9TREE|nr:Cupredoxin [Naematelia encephala]